MTKSSTATSIGGIDPITLRKASTEPLTNTNYPGLIPKRQQENYNNFRVRYQKFNICVPEDITMLEDLETKSLRGQKIYVMGKKDFVFMDQMYILVHYLEDCS